MRIGETMEHRDEFKLMSADYAKKHGIEIENKGCRAYKLENGDIFTISFEEGLKHFEHENSILYVVIKEEESLINQRWKRTGVSYTREELNELICKDKNINTSGE